jgi:hypothetical protein
MTDHATNAVARSRQRIALAEAAFDRVVATPAIAVRGSIGDAEDLLGALTRSAVVTAAADLAAIGVLTVATDPPVMIDGGRLIAVVADVGDAEPENK